MRFLACFHEEFRMNLDQLLHFTRVAEYGSFTRAAISLSMSQPAISRSIRQLEVELRKNLFHRHGRGTELTDEGRRLLTLASKVFDQLEEAREIFTGDISRISGAVTVGLPPTLGRVLTVPIVQAFQSDYPLARLSIVEGLSRVLLDRVLGDRVDVAVVYDPPPCAALEIQPLTSHPLYLFSSLKDMSAMEEGDVAFSEIEQKRLILPSQPNPIRMLVESEAARNGIRFDVSYEVDGIESILRLVENGIGQTIGTSALLSGSHRSGSLVARKIKSPTIQCVVSLATLHRGSPSLLQKHTVELIRKLVTSAFLDGSEIRPSSALTG